MIPTSCCVNSQKTLSSWKLSSQNSPRLTLKWEKFDLVRVCCTHVKNVISGGKQQRCDWFHKSTRQLQLQRHQRGSQFGDPSEPAAGISFEQVRNQLSARWVTIASTDFRLYSKFCYNEIECLILKARQKLKSEKVHINRQFMLESFWASKARSKLFRLRKKVRGKNNEETPQQPSILKISLTARLIRNSLKRLKAH
jgi:hypothetical protein